MRRIRRLLCWLFGQLERKPEVTPVEGKSNRWPGIAYDDVRVLGAPILSSDVESGVVYCIVNKGKPRWVLFRCPCGCFDVITLSVQIGHTPHWVLKITNDKRPTLHPSIWREEGCLSHFWVKNGRVFWCSDTGIHPGLKRI